MLLTVKDVADRLNVSQSCIYQLVETGKIPHHRIGVGRGAIRFTEDDISEYLQNARELATAGGHSRSATRPKLKHIKL
ncbi:helix-turn-helix domain-containing protein [bacterium]|nr:helix-turn-helix domain-containing protein [bacterium]